MARSSECTEQYAQKVFDRDPHCQRGLFSTIDNQVSKPPLDARVAGRSRDLSRVPVICSRVGRNLVQNFAEGEIFGMTREVPSRRCVAPAVTATSSLILRTSKRVQPGSPQLLQSS